MRRSSGPAPPGGTKPSKVRQAFSRNREPSQDGRVSSHRKNSALHEPDQNPSMRENFRSSATLRDAIFRPNPFPGPKEPGGRRSRPVRPPSRPPRTRGQRLAQLFEYQLAAGAVPPPRRRRWWTRWFR